ncbi:MAG TPA: hypothetical protein VLK82_10190 [Candidatus Tectomicrobia bacterium]|nr:hypothetical protein [Candidatus Tectomicrobia bacterium]
MSSGTLELLKILGSFIGALVGAIGALSFKEYLDQRRLQAKERQTRWLPLLRAAQDLKLRLDELTSIYKTEPPTYPWNNYTWKDAHGDEHPLPLEARDFHELYLLDKDTTPIDNFQELNMDPGARRKDEHAVQAVRARIHELNRATTSLYRTAKYLGYAQRVRRELAHGQLEISRQMREQMIELLSNVRKELNGTSEQHPGAGLIDDLQDLIGESVWGQDDSVISYYEFRERLLGATGWEQFTDLFRFFVHFHKKIDTEVKQTNEALATLCSALQTVVEPGRRSSVPL